MFKHNSHFIVFLLVLIQFPFGDISAQGDETSSAGERLVSDVTDTFHGSVHVFSKPLYWQGDDWLNFGYVIAGAATISLLDKEIRSVFQRNKGKAGDAIANIGEVYGEPLSIVLITGGIYLFGNIMDNTWARETAVIMTSALVPGGIYQTFAKISAGRARPYLELGRYYFDPFRMEEDYYSFVSGHTLVAMGTSFVLASRINNSIAKGLFYSLGVMTGLSRIYSDNHWSSDVFLGGALAYYTAKSAAGWLRDNEKMTAGEVNWQFLPSGNGLSVLVAW